jgi:Fic family protein
MEELEKALELKKELDSLRPIDPETEAIIMQKFRLDWNYHSNHLEGNALTYGETKALLLFNITAQGKPLKDHIEVTGHNEAINWVLDLVKGDRPLSESFIRQIHQLLLKEPYEVDAITPDGKPTKKRVHVGEYKKTPNHVKTVTGEIFRFATPEETPAKMTDLLNWYRSKTEEETVNPIFVAAEFHYKFIRIHPFDDGNGRTARIIMNFVLMKYGFPPTIIKTEDKENYFAALRLADAGKIEAFIQYIAQNLIYSLELMIAGAKGESVEEDDDVGKELALLEQRLAFINSNDTININSQIVSNILKKSGHRLLEEIKLKQKKLFKNFYADINVGGATRTFPSINNQSKPIVSEFIISLITSEINIASVKESFGFDVKFIFKPENYSILFNEKTEKELISRVLLEKNYRTELSESEINQIVNKTIKVHKNYIEKIISKKENSKKDKK